MKTREVPNDGHRFPSKKLLVFQGNIHRRNTKGKENKKAKSSSLKKGVRKAPGAQIDSRHPSICERKTEEHY